MLRKELERKLMLQLFAEDGGEPEPKDPDGGEPDKKDPEPEDPRKKAKYSDEDVDKMFDKKFAQWEAKKQKEIDEAKRLANMSAEEKKDKEMKDLQARLASFEAQANAAKMAEAARGIFKDKGVTAPDAIVNMLIADDAETTKSAVEAYIEVFQNEVQEAVKKALAGKEPARGTGGTGMTKEQIMAVTNRAERQRLINENPKLFGI